jgi:tripartite-type tricarboxylate transporter receptor subunit TctC
MKEMGKSFWVFLMAAIMVFSAGMMDQAWAKYPERPITLICPWAAGGGTDALSRLVAALLEKDLGVPVNVVNRTGGSGATGHTAGATAKPDGYTITMITVEITMMHWRGLAEVTYKDYEPVAQLNLDAAGVNVNVNAPWKSMKELNDYVRANPGKLTASGTGVGGIWDLARAGWLKAAGLGVNDVRWVPSRGAAPGLQECVAGGIDVVTCSIPEAASLIEAGKIRALAIMADERHPAFPDVPTLKEQGMDWSVGAWRGIGMPRGTPGDIVSTMEKALEKVVATKEFKDFMTNKGYGTLYRSSKEFGKFMAEADEANGILLKETGIVK